MKELEEVSQGCWFLPCTKALIDKERAVYQKNHVQYMAVEEVETARVFLRKLLEYLGKTLSRFTIPGETKPFSVEWTR